MVSLPVRPISPCHRPRKKRKIYDPALKDVQQKLEAGARVADVGCGKGASTLLMAKAFPKSRFYGFDYHDKSIQAARESAKREGLSDRVTFEVARAKDFPGKDYDFVAVFDCLHDMGDPVGAAAQKLEAGARVADVGCGKGASTLLMAKAFPKSRFYGFDYHDKSIEAARESAKREGLSDRVTFEVARAKDFPGKDYDFVAVFDCLHDMGDPVGAAAHVRQSLAKDGTWMIVEPFANDQLKDNLNPVGRVYYSFSTLLCTPCSRSQEVGLCLGAQAGEARIGEVVNKAGFGRFRRATETPFNIVYEARP